LEKREGGRGVIDGFVDNALAIGVIVDLCMEFLHGLVFWSGSTILETLVGVKPCKKGNDTPCMFMS
jgi:hypothetical protein